MPGPIHGIFILPFPQPATVLVEGDLERKKEEFRQVGKNKKNLSFKAAEHRVLKYLTYFGDWRGESLASRINWKEMGQALSLSLVQESRMCLHGVVFSSFTQRKLLDKKDGPWCTLRTHANQIRTSL
jgi:hypothetical protein